MSMTGAVRIFTRAEVSAEAVMASACLPLLFRAVEIDGVSYWDGGYSGNPALIPFLRATASEDVLIVQINPRERRKTPTRTREILSRVNEVNFNASLLAELRAVTFVNRLIDEGRLPRGMQGGRVSAPQAPSHRHGGNGRDLGAPARSTPSTNPSKGCTSSASARRGVSSIRIITTSAAASTIDAPGQVELELVE